MTHHRPQHNPDEQHKSPQEQGQGQQRKQEQGYGYGGHPAAVLLRHYTLGTLGPAARHRLEPHLDHCLPCRTRLLPLTDPAELDLDHGWRRLDLAADLPVPGRWERALLALGVPDHITRILAATPALRTGWLCGTLLTLLCTAGTAWLATPPTGPPITLLAIAPLLPAAGIAGALGRHWDPGYELGQVAAVSAFRLVLVRTTAVLATTLLLTGAASFALPEVTPAAFAWLLPSLLVTVVSLLLLPRLGSVPAAATAATGWLLLVAVTRESGDPGALFSPPAQSALAAALLLATTALVLRRAGFDLQKGRPV
ncbi:hypothetical protein ABT354_33780 [Streptomyces sp. NPDC000594]|uniref:zf-HC2 domain-containing protein n=1 Tax=Streptomyces sp. NPDC000594 TaxID=3154261 RepID=UPI00332DCF0B